ncbi:MAG: hypothetical protein K8S55_11240 [Phycisphaerae bacterium]|nr:hypothetical protein [Phycisphaerae bacterium]
MGLRELSAEAAIAGLDFLVRHQNRDDNSADRGRFPDLYNCDANRIDNYTIVWTTGVAIEALLIGYRFCGDEKYLDTAGSAIRYIKSLQIFSPSTPRHHGAFREETPQTDWSHPRDGLTAAWALLDWSQQSGDLDAEQRAKLFAEWFITVAMKDGYPYWTVRFNEDDQAWKPLWYGSFHSGGAFFFYRLYKLTGEDKYRRVMESILRHYNRNHLDAEGRISVIRDRRSGEVLDGGDTAPWSNPGWEVMHVYNDDFGALANLAAFTLKKEPDYRKAAECFLRRMLSVQRVDGGFGPKNYSVPSAGGTVLMELIAARSLGLEMDCRESMDRAVNYLLKQQVRQPSNPSDGAFLGMDDEYVVSKTMAHCRTAAYAIMALLRYAGATDPFYFLEKSADQNKENLDV